MKLTYSLESVLHTDFSEDTDCIVIYTGMSLQG